MKLLGILFLSLSAAFAQAPAVNFLTGQAARITIGQTTFTDEYVPPPIITTTNGTTTATPTATQYQVGAVDGVAYANNNLFVVDASFFPSSSAVNPALTIAAQAIRVADHMARNDFGITGIGNAS